MKIIVEIEPEDMSDAKCFMREAIRKSETVTLPVEQPSKTENMNWDEAEAAMKAGECCDRLFKNHGGRMTQKLGHNGHLLCWHGGGWLKVPVTQPDREATDWRIVPDPSKPDDSTNVKPDPYPLTREQAFDVLAGGGKVRHEGLSNGEYYGLDHHEELVLYAGNGSQLEEYTPKSFLIATRWQEVK